MFIVERIVHCPFHKVLSIEEALEHTITSFEGLGGYEILGKYRKGGPAFLKDTSLNNKRSEQEEIIFKNQISFNDEMRNYIGNTIPIL